MDREHESPTAWMIKDVAAMEQCGEEIGRTITGPGLVALVGPMGAGKTHFAKGFSRGLEYNGEVSSPTFALVQEYFGGRWPIFHFDFYRMTSAAEVLAIGWDDYLDQQGVLLVEWADLFPELWPQNHRLVRIEVCGPTRNILYQNIYQNIVRPRL
jgi:tRNA threonylcarbamoyladenosine biosynthesis protein TsaE